jgi:hypothetical protein
VFTSASLSLAALERFVHTDLDLEPDDLVAVAIDIGADLVIHEIAVSTEPGPPRRIQRNPPHELGENTSL